ncbi:MAG: hypothetical protein NTZ17_11605 [Phycisphaerae bacterium]|nr:hypothetical protein [Phycisphaerae bacterium]
MKKIVALVIAIAVVGLFTLPAMAQTAPANTAYGQEGTAADGYGAINTTGHGPEGIAGSTTNWKWQTGSGSYSGVYSWDGTAWVDIADTGNSKILVECDIEMYWSETTTNNEIYFHIGNPVTATDADKIAIVNGTYATNHPMYVGISFDGTTKVEADFELGTGIVKGGMVGTKDIGGRDISGQNFDVMFLCRLNGGTYLTPTSFGAGAHGTEPACLWWSPAVTGMATALGNGTMDFLVKILPGASQADGNYKLDPVIVRAPTLY